MGPLPRGRALGRGQGGRPRRLGVRGGGEGAPGSEDAAVGARAAAASAAAFPPRAGAGSRRRAPPLSASEQSHRRPSRLPFSLRLLFRSLSPLPPIARFVIKGLPRL